MVGLSSLIFFFQISKPLLISSEEICFPRFYREEKILGIRSGRIKFEMFVVCSILCGGEIRFDRISDEQQIKLTWKFVRKKTLTSCRLVI